MTETVKSGTAVTELESVAVLFEVFVSPPPDAVTVFVRVPEAVDGTLTPIMIAGYELPLASASDRVQVAVFNVQVQPFPLKAFGVRPAGNMSITETAPEVAVVPELVTVIV